MKYLKVLQFLALYFTSNELLALKCAIEEKCLIGFVVAAKL